jgi:hypothetical protein
MGTIMPLRGFRAGIAAKQANNVVMSEIPPGGQPGGYYNPGDYPRGPSPQSSGRGTLILVLGILSLVICGLIGPFAWVMGNNALNDVKRGLIDPSEQGLIVAGRVLGIISTCLILLVCGFYALFLILGFGMIGLGAR